MRISLISAGIQPQPLVDGKQERGKTSPIELRLGVSGSEKIPQPREFNDVLSRQDGNH
jgi:hypothetical protein